MTLRAAAALLLLAAACSPPPTTPVPTLVDCHVITWSGELKVEQFTATRADSGTYTPNLTACDCGFARGVATCTFNPSTQRFDGRCRSCVGLYCLGANDTPPVRPGADCACAASTGAWSCPRAGEPARCACPEDCAPLADGGPRRCGCDGGVGDVPLCGSDGGLFACRCGGSLSTDGGDGDGGSIDAGTVDAGTVDAGTVDAGTADAGTVDAGTADAGTSDAATADGG